MTSRPSPPADTRKPPAADTDTDIIIGTASHDADNHDTTSQRASSSELDTPPSEGPANPKSATTTIKCEHGEQQHDETQVEGGGGDAIVAETNGKPPTLRPAPLPSRKRRESEAALHTPDAYEKGNDDAKAFKKRKRGASPPWQFPTVQTSTLRNADGRRVSARVRLGTPGLSESDDQRGRSTSVSTSQPLTATRSRPPSPPWKKVEAEGPTSIIVDGQRKSGRVNKELAHGPKRVSPRTKKHVNKLAGEKHAETKQSPAASKSMGGIKRKSDAEAKNQVNGVDRPSTSSDSAARIAELRAQIAALQPTRSFDTPTTNADHTPKSVKSKSRRDLVKHEPSQSPPLERNSHRPSEVQHSPDRAKSSPRIKLKLSASRRVIEAPHPLGRPPSPLHPPRSLQQVIEEYELAELQQPYTENDRGPPDAEFFVQRAIKQAEEEGVIRKRLLKEAEPGGALSREKLSLFRDERQAEPPQQYDHHDHLVAHTLFLRQLQIREKTQHRLLAKKLAHEALEKWKARHGPTEEDIIAERIRIFDHVRKQVVADMKAKWEMVEAHVQELKKRAWEREQERIRSERLQKKLEGAKDLLAKQRGYADSEDIDMDEDSTGDVHDSNDSEEEDSEENMSDSDSESGEDEPEEEGEMDKDDLAAYLAQREAEPPDRESDADDDDEDDENDDDHAGSGDESMAGVEEEPKDDALAQSSKADEGLQSEQPHDVTETGKPDEMDTDQPPASTRTRDRTSRSPPPDQTQAEVEAHLSSDESTDMDSEDYDSDEDMSSTGDEADNDDDDDGASDASDEPADARTSLLGFYSKTELMQDRNGGLPTPNTSVENDGDDQPRPQSEPRSEGQADAGAAEKVDSQEHSAAMEHIDVDRTIEVQPRAEEDEGTEQDNAEAESTADHEEHSASKSMVPQPTLLRGTLRSYQQAGLDWLASLYRNGTNGILADEMGLGKTIQTISLLAHLAEVHEVWETHLVIVPTSVILNWVTEFQKFLPGFRVLGYYGTAEERAFKRKGWTNDAHHDDKTKRGYNVVITSYNVAMQDINAIRNVQWHYLILDEAHNIRNFNSQRWQVLIRLRTRARLLLTGTPLQNDLAEVWSLLTFLTAGNDDQSQGELEEFLAHWKDPVKEIFDQGVEKISENAQKVVEQLHISLRPFLLRRKKIEVEKDLPKKTESVVVCKLSKRQRQLYQDYMGLAETKATLAKGSGVQAGAVLLSLRRVCNHPDLFDPRPIQTSFAMEYSPLETYGIQEQLIRRMLGAKDQFPDCLMIAARESQNRSKLRRAKQLSGTDHLRRQLDKLVAVQVDAKPDPATVAGSIALQRLHRRERKLAQLRACIQVTESGFDNQPLYGSDLKELVTIHKDQPYQFDRRRVPAYKALHAWLPTSRRPLLLEHPSNWHILKSTRLQEDIATLDSYAERLQETIQRFAFVPPAVTVPILEFAIPRPVQEAIRSSSLYPTDEDYAHEARVRTSIAFPDKRLLIYDSGKLQRLTYLLRELQSKGSRSLIFTQMTGTLNVLEQFLSLMNLPYLRLDGSTPVERRQLYSAEFNRPDSKYQCMILSSRAGGVGLNLTGASSVIFYDLDWNPQMDRQCMDRAHRIGQVRDVEVYKMVSEKTVEENILRRANQKSLLDQTVIQEGHFTTEYQHKEDKEDDVAQAIDRFLGGEEKTTQALASVEDKEDTQAAQQAAKEDRQDDVDFADRSSKGPSKANTPGPGATEVDEIDDERKGHVDLYMIKHMQLLMKDWVYVPAPVRKLDKHGRDPSHRPKKRR
ncbi:hypothetical protein AC578_5571 [Pseudocercospora eumusae]|uniref:DNA helicase n=1 Tax=Pseudocercospora eumusae TaxID=321146 RepID=A0A139HT71_9PEZI|nr:hypothetical protein AC578_5571 [Pseudocercospora eumusae]